MSLLLDQLQAPVVDKENIRRYNRQLREAVGLLIHVSRAAHDADFRQRKLAVKEQVRQRHSSLPFLQVGWYRSVSCLDA
jgi:hypothetical protein